MAAFAVVLDRSLYAAAGEAAQTRTAQIATDLEADQRDMPQAVADTPSRGSLIQVLDARGRVVASSDPAVARRPVASLRPAIGTQLIEQSSRVPGELGEPHAVVAEGIRAATGETFTLIVAVPLGIEDSVRTAVVLLGVGAAALIVLLIFLIDRVVRGALRPVERIRADVAAIERVRADDRVTVPPTADEVARLADTMNRMLDRLQRADDTTRRFVADASHELRSPLATIRAASEIGRSGVGEARPGTGPVVDAELLDVIGAEATRMQSLVDSLLTLAKADDEGLRLTLGDVDLDDLVDEESRRLRTTGDVEVVTAIAPARVVGDAARLRQVMSNLTDNARRHAHGAVRLSVGVDAGSAWFAVEDDGPGIPVDDRERVFDRFVRLDGSRERDSGGSGLGLAIVASIVTAHDGRVRVTEGADGWCRFEVRLPVDGPPVRPGETDGSVGWASPPRGQAPVSRSR